MFIATKDWTAHNLDKLVTQWGYYPTLEISDIMPHLGEKTYNLKAAQKIIERHLWGGEVDANVTVKFLPMDIPGRIELIQTWSSGRLTLNMTIEVSDEYRDNVKAQMTILAHEYAHAFHYLRDDFDRPDDNLEYENLTDLSTIALGMGKLSLTGKEIDKNPYSILTLGYMPTHMMVFAQELYCRSEAKYPSCSEKPHTSIGSGIKEPWSHEEPKFTPHVTTEGHTNRKSVNVWNPETFHIQMDSNNNVIPVESKLILGRGFIKRHTSCKNANKISKNQLEIELKKSEVLLTNLGKNKVVCEYQKSHYFLWFLVKKSQVETTLSQNERITIDRPPVKIIFPGENVFFLN